MDPKVALKVVQSPSQILSVP